VEVGTAQRGRLGAAGTGGGILFGVRSLINFARQNMHFATQDNSWQELLPSNWLYIMSFALFKAGFNSILLLLWMIKCATLMQRMEVDG